MLTERQKMILNAIVDDYIRSAEPVGSRSISKRSGVGFSPATIRNEMADLEDLGFLEQPHTSAGRVPSTKGYRYYVDHLVKLGEVSEQELDRIRTFLADKMNQMEQVIQHAAAILSNMTNYTSIVLGPETFSNTLKHFQLVPLNENTAVAIIVTNTGHVENRTVSIPSGMDMSEMEKVTRILNEKLAGVPFTRLRSRLYSEIGQELSRYVSHYEDFLEILSNVLTTSENDNRVIVSGTSNMLIQPEFKDVDKVKTLLELFDEQPALLKLVSSSPGGIQVKIGSENNHEAIINCSLITATYTLDGHSLGTIGILGPTRMEYGKVISLLDVVSKDMAVLLGKWYK